MTRLTSYEKGGFFKLPPEHLAPFASLFAPSKHGGRLLDPCAGEGEALAFFANAWNLTPYANELDDERAAHCKERFGPRQTVHGDMFTLKASNYSFDLWLNPPYAWDTASDVKRREFGMLKHAWKWLRPEGYLAWCVYKHHVTAEALSFLVSRCTQIDLWALPGLHLGEYHQVVVVARQGEPPEDSHQITGRLLEAVRTNAFPALSEHQTPCYQFAEPIQRKHFVFLPEQITPAEAQTGVLENGAQYGTAFQALVEPQPTAARVSPVVRPRGGQLALVLMAGLFNGLIVETEKGPMAIRSTVETLEVKVEDGTNSEADDEDTNGEGGSIDREVYRTQSVVTISLISENGDYEEISGDGPIASFIKTHKQALLKYLDQHFAPMYDFNYNAYQSLLARPKGGKLYQTQRHVAAACLTALKSRQNVILVGEPGTGKTILGSTIAAGLMPQMRSGQVVVTMCPPHLVEKWEREVKEVGVRTHVKILNNVDDVRQFMDTAARQPANTLNFGIISREAAKLGEGWEIAVNWKRTAVIRWPKDAPRPADPQTHQPVSGERRLDIQIPICPCCGKTIVESDDLNHKMLRDRTKPRFQANRPKAYPLPLTDAEKAALDHEPGMAVTPRPARMASESDSAFHVDAASFAASSRRKRGDEEADNHRPASRAWLTRVPRFCPNCRSALWTKKRTFSDPARQANKARQGRQPYRNPRTPLAEHLATRYKDRLFLFISDELHECKSASTDQGEAMMILANAAQKCLGLTGTLYGGNASSLYAIEHTFNSRVRSKYPWGQGLNKWVKTMGCLERIVEYKPMYDQAGVYSGKVRHDHKPKEAPGCSPLLVAEILDHCCFVGLTDMGRKMPDFEEIPVPIEPDAAIRTEYDIAKRELGKYLFERRLEGDSSALGMYLQALLSWPGAPYRPEVCTHNRRLSRDSQEIESYHVLTIPALPEDRLYNKEQWLVDTVKAELEQERGVAVFVRQTGTRDIQGRVADLIVKACPLAKPFILRGSVAAVKRERVLNAQVQQGVNVLICNPRLVQTGLDLLDFPTIIFLEVDYSLFVMSQASRRAWRLIQDRPCKVYYPYYTGLMENQAVELIGRKQQAAALLYGEDTGAGLSALTGGGSGDLLTALANEIGSDTVSTDLRALFAHHAHEVDASESAWHLAKAEEMATEAMPAPTYEPVTGQTADVLALLSTATLPQAARAEPASEPLPSHPAGKMTGLFDFTNSPLYSSTRPSRPGRRRKPNLSDAPADGPATRPQPTIPLPRPTIQPTTQPVQLSLF